MSTWQQYVDFMKGKGNIDEVMVIASGIQNYTLAA
jgi:hypothetical protein